jgi:hypothetical protein
VAKCVRKRINEKFAKLYREDEVGKYVPHVCLICDEFVKADHLSLLMLDALQRSMLILKPGMWNAVLPALKHEAHQNAGNFQESKYF